MNVGYLVNQYPHITHTFIRREIAALERHGLTVNRFSIRLAPNALVDPADLSERDKTHVILDDGMWRLGVATMFLLFTRPLRWIRTLIIACRLRRRARRGIIRHIAYFAEACQLQRLTRNVDHLHAHFGTNSTAVAMLCHLLGGPKFSFTVHGPEEFDDPHSLGLDAKIQHADFVVAISSFCRSQLFRLSRSEDWPKIHIIRCGLDTDYLNTPLTPVPDSNQIVCIGRLSEQKGQMLLLKAIAQLRDHGQNCQLILAGDGPLRPMIEELIQALDLKQSVRVTGWVSSQQVQNVIRESRALVLPSFAEGLPVVIMETFALGRPVVTTHIAGIPELVQDGQNGWLVPAGSVHELTRVLQQLFQMTTFQLSDFGHHGYQCVRRCHDVNQECKRLAELFELSATHSSGVI